jgi:hypothetical protein
MANIIQHGKDVFETQKKAQSTRSLSVQKKVSRGGGAEAPARRVIRTLRAAASRSVTNSN